MSASDSTRIRDFIEEHRDRFREELLDFLRLPSVSARSEHSEDVRRTAEWVAEAMRAAGLEADVEETDGHPLVLGRWSGAGADAPTVLIYGHYDVQPPEPLELWTSPPFEPDLRGDRLYARGAVDDKGQLYLHLKAIEAHMSVAGRLPVNVIVLVEGEEEVGSPNLMPYVERHAEALAADYVVISDTSMFAPGVPTISASLRGLAYFQVDVESAGTDLHSGSYGGALINPATALARILASLHDERWRVAIEGFYDDVQAPEEFLERIRSLPFDEAGYLEETGASSLGGEEGYGTYERLWVRPTLDVNGLLSGYTGEGPKTVLPARAMAKVSCRLVPDQEPERIDRLFREHVERVAPEGVRVSVTTFHTGRPWRARLDGPLIEAASRALESAFGRDPVFAGEGGSIPIVVDFERILGAPALLMGFALPGANTHAPDEWISMDAFHRGTHAAARLLSELAAVDG